MILRGKQERWLSKTGLLETLLIIKSDIKSLHFLDYSLYTLYDNKKKDK